MTEIKTPPHPTPPRSILGALRKASSGHHRAFKLPDAIAGVDMAEALLSVGEADLLTELLQQMTKSWRDGAERISRAFVQRGPATAAATVHGLWGVAATLGAVRVRDCAARLERQLLEGDCEHLEVDLRELDAALVSLAEAVSEARRRAEEGITERREEPRRT